MTQVVPKDKEAQDASDESKEAGRVIYAMLGLLTTGRAFQIVQGVKDCNGYEAWRLMVREFEPRKDLRNRGWLTNIIHKPRFDSSMDSVQWRDQFMKWLEDVDDYETTMEDIVDPSVRIAVAYENAPGYLPARMILTSSTEW